MDERESFVIVKRNMLDHLSNQSENLLFFVVVARNPRRACPLLSLLFLAHEFFFEKEIQASQKNLKDFQDVITTVLLHFPHSLTSISHQKKKKRESFLVPVTPALLLVSLRNHWCHPLLPNPTSFNAVQTIRGLAQNHWHTKRKKSLNFLLQMKSGFMGETRQYISWQPKNRNPSVCVDHKINSFLWGHMWPAQGPIWWLPCSVNGLWGSDWNLTQKNSPACVYVVWKTGADKKKKKK